MEYTISARETTYNGHLFRSSLEARWAAFFDLVGWKWVYEPFELKGYIPDFILQFHKPILVEVKPVMDLTEMRAHAAKIEQSGWTHEALIVGTTPDLGEGMWDYGAIGLLGEYSVANSSFWWAEADIIKCKKCNRESFFHTLGSWACRANGCHDGDHYHGHSNIDVRALWGEAHRSIRWIPNR